ncbi:hypothetical protein LQF12_06500 [Ruania suaedae]|uniref:hypothetical protein n=1 Tax=Ruania suaedae TaxID=2897774 RepID=UPI001E3C6A5F|nr:hypothetical protein [Ruania suaedae]UFU04225.1 hypothetical protein LQF12_06500 [Ruania suaedae]
MSALPLRSRPLPAGGTRWRPRLRIVRAPEAGRSRVPFIMLCLGILGAALLSVLLLNTSMAATSYEIHEQRIALARLSEQQQTLAQEADRLASPTQLERAAAEIGMEPAGQIRYLVLSEGRILGEDEALVGED